MCGVEHFDDFAEGARLAFDQLPRAVVEFNGKYPRRSLSFGAVGRMILHALASFGVEFSPARIKARDLVLRGAERIARLCIGDMIRDQLRIIHLSIGRRRISLGGGDCCFDSAVFALLVVRELALGRH